MDDLVMFIFTIAKGFFIFALVTFVLSFIMPPPNKGGPPKEKLKSCPPHKWDYDADGQMYCKLCPRKPGQ